MADGFRVPLLANAGTCADAVKAADAVHECPRLAAVSAVLTTVTVAHAQQLAVAALSAPSASAALQTVRT